MLNFPYTAGKGERDTFDLIPDGTYTVKIYKYKEITNFSQTSNGIRINYQIIDGEYKGRIVFDNFYLEHENEEYKKKQINKFNLLLEAINIPVLYSLSELMDKQLNIKVKISKASSDGKFPEKNIVVDYLSLDSQNGVGVVDDDIPEFPF